MPKRRKKKKCTGRKVPLAEVEAVLKKKESDALDKVKEELKVYKSGLPGHLWALVVGFAFYRQEAASLGSPVKRCLELYPDAFSDKAIGRQPHTWKLPERDIVGVYEGELERLPPEALAALRESRQPGDLLDFESRQPDGWGRFAYTWLSTWKRREYSYLGPWATGKASGDNCMWEHHGFVYRGSFRDGKRDGRGKMTKVYDGEEGLTYTGKWTEDMKHGAGEEWRANRTLLRKGRWEYDNFVYGEMFFLNGSTYKGNWKNVLVGNFGAEDNVQHGKGKLCDAEGRTIAEGFWDGGRHISGQKYDYHKKFEEQPIMYDGCFGGNGGIYGCACIRTIGNVCTLGQWGPSGFEDFPSAHSDPFIYEPVRYEDLLRQYCTPSSRSSSLTPTSEGRYFS